MTQRGDIAKAVFAGEFFCDSVNALYGVAHSCFGFAYSMKAVSVMYIGSTAPGCLEIKRPVTAKDPRRLFRDFKALEPALIQVFSELQACHDEWIPLDHFAFEAVKIELQADERWVPPGGGLMTPLEVVELKGLSELSSARGAETHPGA